jgi:ABC-2 type transport system ATP-binding protein
MNLIEIRQVSKVFWSGISRKLVLRDIDLVIQPGEFVVLRGRNGAGKSTLLSLITGLLQPTRGEVLLMGGSPQDSIAKTRVGVVLQETNLPSTLTVREVVTLMRSYYPDALSTDEILSKVDLGDKINDRAKQLSGGQKQRLYFALALAGNPDLMILDEPTRNLDLSGYQEFWEQIRFCRERGITILLVTNNDADRSELCQYPVRIIELHKIKEASSEGQLGEIACPLERRISTVEPNLRSPSLLNVFWRQLLVEGLQLLRTPESLISIIVLATLVVLLPVQGKSALEAVGSFAGIITISVSMVQLGGRVSIERADGWLKLLRISPLPSSLYITTKVCLAASVCLLSLLIMLILGVWKLNMDFDLGLWFQVILSIIVGAIPFATIGLALSYLISPQGFNAVAGLFLVVGVASSGFIPFDNSLLRDLAVLSPFYHYSQLIQWSTDSAVFDGRLWLHLLWLLWTGVVFGLLANWAFQRDAIVR